MTIRVRDNGANAVLKAARKSPEVKVGVIGKRATAQHKKLTGATVVDIATIHEFGLGVPRRSFLRDYVDINSWILRQYMRNAAEQIIKGDAPKKVFEVVGLVIASEIQERISDHIPPPLKKSTIDRKGSKTPLVDTGQLKSSITFAAKVN